MTSIEPMNLESEDLVADRIEQLKTLFPEIATEGDGTVDFEKLRLIMGDEVNEDDERYAFTWPGKRDAIRLSQMPSTATLRPAVDESRSRKGEDGSFDSDNLYIEGDNLEVLKLLQHSYHGKVKMIYIDPPYNTGHDFVYKDSFGDTIGNYKKQAGVAGQSNADTSGRYHSDWCSMMYPRLKLARELLADDGVIFISIDDNEVRNARLLCDELFGEQAFVGQVVWQKRTSPDMRKRFSTGHEYVLIYLRTPDAVNNAIGLLPLTDSDKAGYKNPDNDPRGPWVSSDYTAQGYRPNQMYEITTPSGAVYVPPAGTCWKNVEEEYLAQSADGRFWYGRDGSGMPRRKTYLCEREGRNCWTWWPNREVGHTQEATKELKSLFPESSNIFDFPKPIRLLERIISLASRDGDIVMDFFSGSASLAHAVIGQSCEDKRRRRFILVQIPEPSAGQFDNLCEIGKERIRRAGAKIAAEIEESNKQLKLGEDPKPIPDIGFRVFKLDESGINKQDLNAAAERGELFGGDTLLDSVIKPSRSDMDIVFEMMLKWGLELTLPIEAAQVAGYKCYIVAGGELVCCMEAGLTVEALETIAKKEPRRVLMLDSVLTDTLKLNAVQIFKRVGDRTGIEVELRTV